MLEIGLHRASVGLGDHECICSHDQVEACSLQGLRHLHVKFPVPRGASTAERSVPLVRREFHEPTHVEWFYRHFLLTLIPSPALEADRKSSVQWFSFGNYLDR